MRRLSLETWEALGLLPLIAVCSANMNGCAASGADYGAFTTRSPATATIPTISQESAGGAKFSAFPTPLTWRVRTDDPNRVYLYDGTTQVGAWCYVQSKYAPCDPTGDTWGNLRDRAPLPVPKRTEPTVPFGVGQAFPAIPTPVRSAVAYSFGSPVITQTVLIPTSAALLGITNCRT